MLPIIQKWAIFPGVVAANATTTMTIAPVERSFLFFEDAPYTVTVIATDADEPDYHHPATHQTLTVTAKGGVLTFPFAFGDEQEYTLLLSYEEKQIAELAVYALEPDLLALRPLRGDLHGHSYRSDGLCDPAALAGHYREQGYDFFALTDHNRYYPGDEVDAVYAGVRMGLAHVAGEEIHTPETQVHIVHAGGHGSVCVQYQKDAEADFFKSVENDYLPRVPASVPEVYRYRYAEAMWATDKVHEVGGLAIFPHPYWKPGPTKAHNVRTEFARILLKSGMFDAYELVGGMGQVGNNHSVALWQELRAEGCTIPVVGSSDVHTIEKSSCFPHLFTVCFATANENDAVVAAVRAGLSVAVEASGVGYERHYRVYGARRLVAYTHFLMKNYFAPRQRLAEGEGVAMRAYAMGDTSAATVELQAELSELHYRRFFGKAAPITPSAKIIQFVAKCRERQLAGPPARGTVAHPAVPNRNL